MKRILVSLSIVLLLGAGCNNNSMNLNAQNENVQTTQQIINSEELQTIEFAVNTSPFTGGPAYRVLDAQTGEQKTLDGNSITLPDEDFKKIDQLMNVDTEIKPAKYLVKAQIQLKKVTDINDSLPGAPEITYYEAQILKIYDVHQ